jgi:PAS domain S-box-containing protein
MNPKPPPLGELQVVVVNDDATQLNVLSGLLRKEGLTVRVYPGAVEAIDAFRSGEVPDLIVTDLYMPVIDGWRFCRLLRSPEFEAFNRVPILAVSATFSGDEPRRITADLGANAFLPAPVNAAQFIETVRALLRNEVPRYLPKVLLVEDSKVLSMALKRAFDAHGYQAQTALTGQEAVQKFNQDSYDLVVLDYYLPDTQGDQLLLEFKRRQPGCVFVMITTDPRPELALSWIKKGAAAYARKPFDSAYLVELCEKARRERALIWVEDLLEERTRQLRESEKVQAARLRLLEYAVNHSVEDLLQRMLDEAELLTDSSIGFFHYLGADQKTVHPKVWSTRTIKEFCRAAGNGSHYDLDAAGVWVDCVRERRAVIHNDYASLAHRKGLPEGHPHVIRDLATPIFRNNLIVAMLGVGNKPGDYTDQDLHIVSQLADLAWDIAERRQAEDALKQREQLYHGLLESTRAVFWDLELASKHFTYISSQAEKIFGYPLGKWTDLDFWASLIHPEDRDAAVRFCLEAAAREQDHEVDYRLKTKAGSYLWIRDIISHVKGKAASAHLRGFMIDVTRQKEAETAILKARADLVQAQRVTQLGSWTIDAATSRFACSEVLYHLFELDPAASITSYGMLLDAVHPEDRARVDQAHSSLIAHQTPHRIEYRLLTRDGRSKLVDQQCHVTHGEDGRPLQFFCTVQDITDRKRSQKELLASKERYQRVSELTGQLVYDWDIASGAIEWAGKIKELTGYSVEAFNSQGISGRKRHIHPDDREAIGRLLSEAKQNHSLFQSEYRYQRADGSYMSVEDQGAFEYDPSGTAVRMLGVMKDITLQKLAAQEALKMEAHLRQAQKMEAIGTLAGGIAHDFNNLLGAIMGNAELMSLADDLQPAQGQGLNQILGASRRAKQLVHQILAFSRRSESQKLVVNLKPIIKETMDFLRASLPTTIELKSDVKSDVGTIIADPTQMQQVLMNLCTNAWHAMEQTGGVLKIQLADTLITAEEARLNPEVPAGGYVQLSVSDTGHGIGAEILEEIFNPYFTTKPKGKGTGLGLSVVDGIVKSHGGMIKVYSEVGRGTTIHVFLPRADDVDKLAANDDRKPLPKGTERVLFVDDEVLLVDMGRQMLGRLGYQVETRTSPVEALEAFRANPQKFDLIITDLTMPQFTGLDVAKKIREIRPDIPIILCTGFSDMANEQKARALGIRAFLLKPVSMKDIADTIRKVLDERPAPSPSIEA